MTIKKSELRSFADCESGAIDAWLIEGENEFHPGLDKRYSPDIRFRRFKTYHKLGRLLPVKDWFTNRSILHVGPATGAYNFVLRYANPSRLIALEPNAGNYDFLRKSSNVHYNDYIQARLEDLPTLNRHDFDMVFIGNCPVTDWSSVITSLTQQPNVVDIVIHNYLFTVEHSHTKYCSSYLPSYPDETKIRYGTWNGEYETEFWSIGEMQRVASENGFATVYKHYDTRNKNPISWSTLIFSRLD